MLPSMRTAALFLCGENFVMFISGINKSVVLYNISTICKNYEPFSFARRWYSKLGPTDLKGRKTTAQKWLLRQWSDPYVKRARQESYRCRSAYKLMEIDDRFRFLHEGMVVIDCGASPGSWSQVAVERVNAVGADKDKPRGLVISVDLQTIDPLPGAVILDKCDITQNFTIQRIEQVLQERKVDIVLSDMAPSATGVRSLDHEQIVQLAMAVLKLSCRFLRETTSSSIPSHSESGGSLLLKLWQGKDTDVVLRSMQKCFHDVRILKPVASRSNSAEIYLFAQHFTLTKTVPIHGPS